MQEIFMISKANWLIVDLEKDRMSLFLFLYVTTR